MERHQASHDIAVAAARQLVHSSVEVGLSWTDITTSCETFIAIVVSMAAKLSDTPDQVRFSAEIIDTMTERAQKRVTALLMGVPYEG